MMKVTRSVALLVGLLAIGFPALAHHGNAAMGTKLVEFPGATITKLIWASPHTIVMFDAKDEKGEIVHWAVEAGSPPSISMCCGWTKNALHPGDVVTVYAYPAKSGQPVGRLNKVVLADGRSLHDSQLGADKPADKAPGY